MKWNDSGQVLLIVILIAVVALTVGLSLVSRSITGVRVATQSEESQRAFQAAEAGVERALNAIRLSPTPPATLFEDAFENNAAFDATINTLAGADILLNGGSELEQSVGSDVWLSRYPDFSNPMTTTIEVHFGSQNQNQCLGTGADVTPAIEILVLSGASSNPSLSKHVVDPCSRIDGAANEDPGGSVDGVTYAYSYDLNISNALLARVVPIYNSTIVGLSAQSGTFPSQGSIIESTGTAGESVRRVQVFESHPQIPIEMFQYAILSQ